jgi:hypothetical protein
MRRTHKIIPSIEWFGLLAACALAGCITVFAIKQGGS